jgi:hypothetical protein
MSAVCALVVSDTHKERLYLLQYPNLAVDTLIHSI